MARREQRPALGHTWKMGRSTRAPSAYPGAESFVPAKLPSAAGKALVVLANASQDCRGCELYARTTHAVFGDGPSRADIMLIGEQPGDQEDLAAKPFVGPAGKLLDRALADAGIERGSCYLTNAVKHFKWAPSPRGKRRIHAKPSVGEVRACRPWLEHEIALVKPRMIILLGATAARSLLGAAFRVTAERGRVIDSSSYAPLIVATVHPSSVLRAPNDGARDVQYQALVADLRVAAAQIKRS